jgi:hypothetical protein
MGNQPLIDDDRFVWSGQYDDDLIALGQPPGDDFVSRWVIGNLIPYLYKRFRCGNAVRGRFPTLCDKILLNDTSLETLKLQILRTQATPTIV